MKYIFIIGITLFYFGCDIFSTRDAEPPEQPRTNQLPATTPEVLIDNLISSLNEKVVENYISCFTDSTFSGKNYIFKPSAGSAQLFPAFSESWDKQKEEQYFNNMKSNIEGDLPITLLLTSTSSTPFSDSLLYSAKYYLTVPHSDSNIPQSFQGDLEFVLIRDFRLLWTIFSWRDIRSEEFPSWSELKGRFY